MEPSSKHPFPETESVQKNGQNFLRVLDKVSKAAKITSKLVAANKQFLSKIIRLIWFSQKKVKKSLFAC
jgi:hypothetical protein